MRRPLGGAIAVVIAEGRPAGSELDTNVRRRFAVVSCSLRDDALGVVHAASGAPAIPVALAEDAALGRAVRMIEAALATVSSDQAGRIDMTEWFGWIPAVGVRIT
jgi:hypothetical protein